MIIVPFLPMHLEGFEPQDMQIEVLDYMSKIEYGEYLFNAGEASSLVDEKVIACAGLSQIHKYRAESWAIISKDIKPNQLLRFSKEIRNFFNKSPIKRIETTVLHSFENGHKWAKLLGMKNETPDGLDGFGMDGEK